MTRPISTDMATLQAFSGVWTAWKSHEGEFPGYVRHRLSDADAAELMPGNPSRTDLEMERERGMVHLRPMVREHR